MNLHRRRFLLAATASAFAPALAAAQGFAGLGVAANGFRVPQPDTRLTFPGDHLAHPGFRIEWWYLTGNLKGANGRDYGVQWTVFRSALQPPETAEAAAQSVWAASQVWMAHAALTSDSHHSSAERFARGGIGQAGARLGPLEVWLDHWALRSEDDTMDRLRLQVAEAEFAFDLSLQADAPLVLQGHAGYSVKSRDGQASHYYSQPFFSLRGSIVDQGAEVAVTGTAWLDREWSSQPLSADQTGWDWFGLSLSDGRRIMGFVLRDQSDTPFVSGSLIAADGRVTPLGDGDFLARPLAFARVEGRDIPVIWQVTLPQHGIDLRAEALNPNAWMGGAFPYWEGPLRLTGSDTGVGYLEMTGR